MRESFDSDKNKIRCRNCQFIDLETDICSKKKAAVGINKTRYCSLFVFDKDKLIAREEKVLEAQRRSVPRKRKVYQEPNLPMNYAASSAHPVTGDLSRFSTTGS